jgi:hypothetical protein
MLATVTNAIQDMFLSLRLEQIEQKLGWINLDTGHLHGTLYSNPSEAVRGLQRMYDKSHIRLRPGAFAA